MKREILPKVGGVFTLGVFASNVYIGENDTVLLTLNVFHHYANWLLALLDLVAAALLIAYKSKSRRWVFISGVAWPVAYLVLLVADVETDLCLFTPNVKCLASPSASFQYLILGSQNAGWVLWQYTIPTVIGFLLATLVVCSLFLWPKATRTSDHNFSGTG